MEYHVIESGAHSRQGYQALAPTRLRDYRWPNGCSGEQEETVRGVHVSAVTVKQDSYCRFQEGSMGVAEQEHEGEIGRQPMQGTCGEKPVW